MTARRESCITCADVATAGVVLEVSGHTAVVELEGRRELVGVELVAPVTVGEHLLCHAGIAIARLADGEGIGGQGGAP